MKKIVIFSIIIACALVVGFAINYTYTSRPRIEIEHVGTDVPLSYYRLNDALDTSQPSLELQPVMSDILKSCNRNVDKAIEYIKCNFLLFESLNFIDQTLAKLSIPTSVKFLYGIRGSDYMASKSNLAQIIKNKGFGEIIPVTYIPERHEDMELLIKNHDNTKIYIMKKNIQRQEGILITRSLDEIMQKMKDYVVIQELLKDPYLISKRKINIRVYLLITVDTQSQCQFYIYHNGFMYYTAAFYEPDSADPEKNITTGYIDRKVYEENPLTIKDLEQYLGKQDFSILWTNLKNVVQKLKHCYKDLLFESNSKLPGTKFNIYGIDIAVDSQLNVKLMEINKGADLSAKDKRDKEVKENLVRDCFTLVGICNTGNATNFVKI